MGVFDTVIVVVGYAKSETEFNRYAETIHDRMSELHRLYDIYNTYDGINNIRTINQNAGVTPVKVDKDIIDMLVFAQDASKVTDGVFNIAMGSVLEIWHEYRVKGIENEQTAALPPMDALLKAAETTSIEDVVIDESKGTVFLAKRGMSLDVGSIAKGYAAGLAVEAAKNAGAVSLLVNAGGNVVSVGKPMDGIRDSWGVGIQNPDCEIDGTRNIIDTVYINDAVVSCSGGYQRFYTVEGKQYHHIIDPATLMPANRYKEVAVIHRDSGVADLLSTALFIMPQDKGAELAEEMQAEALWIFSDDSRKATDGYSEISKSGGIFPSE